MEKNYGLILPEKIETREEGAEHLLGSIPKFRGQVINPSRDWMPHLRLGERQNLGLDLNSCTIEGSHSGCESALKIMGVSENWSEPYAIVFAILSKVLDPARGADPHKMLEMLRKDSGRVLEEAFTRTAEFKGEKPENWDALVLQAKEFYKSWELAHEWVYPYGLSVQEKKARLKEALTRGPVLVAVYAWTEKDGIYFKPLNAQDNHWVQLVKYDEQDRPVIFDSYTNGDSYLKTLDPLYDFGIAKVLYISVAQPRKSIIARLLALIGITLGEIQKELPKVELPKVEPKRTPLEEFIKENAQSFENNKDVPIVPTRRYTDLLAKGIAKYENVNIALNNPGGLRSSPFQNGRVLQVSTSTEKEKKYLATFATYEIGMKALVHQITIVCKGTSVAYNTLGKTAYNVSPCSELTLEQFLHLYAPRYENKTEAYLKFIENWTGLERSVKMKQLI